MLSRREAEILLFALPGEDIFNPELAVEIRRLKKSNLIEETNCFREYREEEQKPLFGAVTTDEGKKELISYVNDF